MEAFVYRWIDKKTNKLYIGSHKGTEDDGYVCSSNLMMEQYNKRPEDFRRHIVAVGKYPTIRWFESWLLRSVNAAKDPRYYNQQNGDGNFYCKGHTEETKRKVAAAGTGRVQSLETRLKRSKTLTGQVFTEERKRNIGRTSKGRIPSEEALLKRSKSLTQYWKDLPEDQRRVRTEKKTGKKRGHYKLKDAIGVK